MLQRPLCDNGRRSPASGAQLQRSATHGSLTTYGGLTAHVRRWTPSMPRPSISGAPPWPTAALPRCFRSTVACAGRYRIPHLLQPQPPHLPCEHGPRRRGGVLGGMVPMGMEGRHRRQGGAHSACRLHPPRPGRSGRSHTVTMTFDPASAPRYVGHSLRLRDIDISHRGRRSLRGRHGHTGARENPGGC